jgi:uncharacterized protein YndB with AHSA1/START domain/DNA-binding transcriptional ArsR family regulator
VDDVFRALNDSSRRRLLDELLAEDGQTLGELCAHLPEMTRYGVMNHLKVLEDGGLVVTKKVGRNKHHYLNPVPIQLVHDRWITKYTEPLAGALAGLKTGLETGGTTVSKPTHIHETYIACTPEQAWQAIIDGDQTVQYFYGTRVESDWGPGDAIRYLGEDGTVVADGRILAIESGHRVDMTFHPHWDPELEAEGEVRTIWIVEGDAGATRVRVEYHDLDPSSRTYAEFTGGIAYIVSGMKTLLETGTPLAAG